MLEWEMDSSADLLYLNAATKTPEQNLEEEEEEEANTRTQAGHQQHPFYQRMHSLDQYSN
ncbi:hypothetical protein MtrunA17_Chr5g0427631 [Medicago truncatula]|uniref:Uncharacterized protein n=1 Tax=Medicago truncatula TaxID=3880 RepID=A0A396HSD9_MEDTR|nr:hypothetical protein MtrunA17_Chr5g0427631 [Medicago truncatula]